MAGLERYMQLTRARLIPNGSEHVRAVYRSEVVRQPDEGEALEAWMTGKVPLYYRDPAAIAQSFRHTTDFRKPIRDTLLKLPTKEGFQTSHFGEILGAIFCEQVLRLRLLYSKLSLLTAENANAYKMDLVLYDPASDPLEFVFGEVKSSPKCGPVPAGHDKGCFASLFTSFNAYGDDDREFDLAVIEDRLSSLPAGDAPRVRDALQPDADPKVRYVGICLIDTATHDDNEAQVLGTRKNAKTFEADLLCVAELGTVAAETYASLKAMESLVRPG